MGDRSIRAGNAPSRTARHGLGGRSRAWRRLVGLPGSDAPHAGDVLAAGIRGVYVVPNLVFLA